MRDARVRAVIPLAWVGLVSFRLGLFVYLFTFGREEGDRIGENLSRTSNKPQAQRAGSREPGVYEVSFRPRRRWARALDSTAT